MYHAHAHTQIYIHKYRNKAGKFNKITAVSCKVISLSGAVAISSRFSVKLTHYIFLKSF